MLVRVVRGMLLRGTDMETIADLVEKPVTEIRKICSLSENYPEESDEEITRKL